MSETILKGMRNTHAYCIYGNAGFFRTGIESIVEAGHQVTAVVTQPDKPKGRGKDVQMTPVKIQALEYGIPVYQPVKVKHRNL